LAPALGFDDLMMRPGDAISFGSGMPRRYRDTGREPAVRVWFLTG
jgi:hypothetical protein